MPIIKQDKCGQLTVGGGTNLTVNNNISGGGCGCGCGGSGSGGSGQQQQYEQPKDDGQTRPMPPPTGTTGNGRPGDTYSGGSKPPNPGGGPGGKPQSGDTEITMPCVTLVSQNFGSPSFSFVDVDIKQAVIDACVASGKFDASKEKLLYVTLKANGLAYFGVPNPLSSSPISGDFKYWSVTRNKNSFDAGDAAEENHYMAFAKENAWVGIFPVQLIRYSDSWRQYWGADNTNSFITNGTFAQAPGQQGSDNNSTAWCDLSICGFTKGTAFNWYFTFDGLPSGYHGIVYDLEHKAYIGAGENGVAVNASPGAGSPFIDVLGGVVPINFDEAISATSYKVGFGVRGGVGGNVTVTLRSGLNPFADATINVPAVPDDGPFQPFEVTITAVAPVIFDNVLIQVTSALRMDNIFGTLLN